MDQATSITLRRGTAEKLKITVHIKPAHIKPACQPCKATKRKLDELEIPYETVELTEESATRFRDEGLTSAPVVEVDLGHGAVWRWTGYAPSQIEALNHSLDCDDPSCTRCEAVIAA